MEGLLHLGITELGNQIHRSGGHRMNTYTISFRISIADYKAAIELAERAGLTTHTGRPKFSAMMRRLVRIGLETIEREQEEQQTALALGQEEGSR